MQAIYGNHRPMLSMCIDGLFSKTTGDCYAGVRLTGVDACFRIVSRCVMVRYYSKQQSGPLTSTLTYASIARDALAKYGIQRLYASTTDAGSDVSKACQEAINGDHEVRQNVFESLPFHNLRHLDMRASHPESCNENCNGTYSHPQERPNISSQTPQ